MNESTVFDEHKLFSSKTSLAGGFVSHKMLRFTVYIISLKGYCTVMSIIFYSIYYIIFLNNYCNVLSQIFLSSK